MGGRLYSGNANAHRDAVDRLRGLGFEVMTESAYDCYKRDDILWHTIRCLDGSTLISRKFQHRDIDCLYNEATSWLTKMYEQLKGWN